MSKILIVKLSSLGDILQVASHVEKLKQEGFILHWVIDKRCEALCPLFPWVDRWIVIDRKKLFRGGFVSMWHELRHEKYDLLYDLQGNCKSGVVTLCARSHKKCGFAFGYAPEWPASLPLNERLPVIDARQMIPKVTLFTKPFPLKVQNIALGLSSRWESKKLSQAQVSGLLARLQKRYPEAQLHLLVAHEEEKKEWRSLFEGIPIHWSVGLSFPLLLEELKKADLYVGVDSMLLHLAAIAGTPSLAFFGPSSGSFYYPEQLAGGYVQGKCPWNLSFAKRCPHLRSCKAPCMQDSTLLDAAECVLDSCQSTNI